MNFSTLLHRSRSFIVCLIVALTASCASNKAISTDPAALDAAPQPSPEAASASSDADTFRIGPGDTISVAVWRQDDLSSTMPVDPDGRIHYPPGSFTKVSGLTIAEAQDLLTSALTNYVVSPKVSVGTVSIKSRKAYVLGEVKTPGTVTLDSPMTILQAVSLMGGYNTDAAPKRILLVRKEGDKVVTHAVHIDMRDAGSKQFTPSVRLRPDDIVFVPPSHIADMERFMNRLNTILNPIVNLERGIVLEPDVADVLTGKSESSSSGQGGSSTSISL